MEWKCLITSRVIKKAVLNMSRKQKLFLAFLVTVVIIALGSSYYYLTPQPENEKISIVATFYPLAFFAEEIGGEYVSVTQLIPNNTELHGWEPSVSHIKAADDADIILYNGANLDPWVEQDVIPSLSNTNDKIIVETTEGVELLNFEEGSEHEDENHDHGSVDPHTWISPFVASQQAHNIYNALVEADPQHEQYYTERWDALRTQLEQLNDAYMQELSSKTQNELFVAHSAFGYLAYRYGFEQHGVIGISADEQPSASTLADLVDMMIEHDVYVIYVSPVYSDEYAQTLKSELEARTGQSVQIVELYILSGPVDGMDYLEQMEKNLDNLKIGLGVP
jgi:zinc transport system substrate-binding protein